MGRKSKIPLFPPLISSLLPWHPYCFRLSFLSTFISPPQKTNAARGSGVSQTTTPIELNKGATAAPCLNVATPWLSNDSTVASVGVGNVGTAALTTLRYGVLFCYFLVSRQQICYQSWTTDIAIQNSEAAFIVHCLSSDKTSRSDREMRDIGMHGWNQRKQKNVEREGIGKGTTIFIAFFRMFRILNYCTNGTAWKNVKSAIM